MRKQEEVDPYEGTSHLWSVPGVSHMTMRRKQLAAFLEATGGEVLARGRLWTVVARYLGAGVYRVQLGNKP